MTMPIRLAAAAVIGALVLGGALLLTGGGSRPSSTVPIPSLSPAAEATRAAGWRVTGAPSLDRGNGSVTATLRDGRLLLVAGGGAPDSAELYDPASGSWSSMPRLRQARGYPIAITLADGRVLVAGGGTDSVEIFDPTAGTWKAASSMTERRGQTIAALLADGRVLVAGGNDDNGGTPGTAEIYDLQADKWTPTGNLIDWRAGPASAIRLSDGRVLVAGGFVNDKASAEIYDPRSGTWAATGPMHAERADEQAGIALGDGRVMICGGQPTSCDLYDPATGTFTATEPPPQTSADLVTLTQLPNGSILLVAGATNQRGSSTTLPTATGQLFDPVSGHWTAIEKGMAATRFVRSASLLPDGTVLVVGVSSATNADGGTPSAEIYTP